jgi:hypothetical protein
MRVTLGSIVAGLVVPCPAAHAAGGPSLPAPVYRTVAVADAGKIYVLGGHDLAGGSVATVEAFDPAHGVARRAGDLVYPTHGAAAANLDGRILVFGGASISVHDVVQEFSPATGRSRVVGTMPTVSCRRDRRGRRRAGCPRRRLQRRRPAVVGMGDT